jgi:hypothetical protein
MFIVVPGLFILFSYIYILPCTGRGSLTFSLWIPLYQVCCTHFLIIYIYSLWIPLYQPRPIDSILRAIAREVALTEEKVLKRETGAQTAYLQVE